MTNNLEQSLTQLVDGLKACGPYCHTATNEYTRRFFLQELLVEVKRHSTEARILSEKESGSMVPEHVAELPCILRG